MSRRITDAELLSRYQELLNTRTKAWAEEALAQEIGVTLEEVHTYLKEAQQAAIPVEKKAPTGRTDEELEKLMHECVCASDDPEETWITFASRLGVSYGEASKMLNEARARLKQKKVTCEPKEKPADYHWIEVMLNPEYPPDAHITLGFFPDASTIDDGVWDIIFKMVARIVEGSVTCKEFVRVGRDRDLLALKVPTPWIKEARATLVDALKLANIEDCLDRTYEFMPHLTLGKLTEIPDGGFNLTQGNYGVVGLRHMLKGGKALRVYKLP